MALEGQLSDFNLPEIFQLISGQKKSGFLNLESQQNMVFIFDKGVLISTRDRRSGSNDPLEKYLRAYGFFDETQWDHIEYIKNNSSLDLTEILVSEKLLDEESLLKALRGIAQEMTFEGMKLRRGRYHFSATRGAPQGVRGRVNMNVQGLLMEAARRLDEEPRLNELFPSPVITFQQGKKAPAAEELTQVDSRILQLALEGVPLGKIICQAQVDSFTTRERLKLFCEMKYLDSVGEGTDTGTNQNSGDPENKAGAYSGLRSRTLTGLLLVLILAAGYTRWEPLLSQEPIDWDLQTADLAASPVGSANSGIAAGRTADPAQPSIPAPVIRRRQLQDDIDQAAALFYHRYGEYPIDLSLLVTEGMLTRATYRLITRLGWTYQLHDDKLGYSLAG